MLWQKYVPLKVVFLFGVCSVIDYHPKIICCGEVFFIRILVSVSLVVALRKWLIIYFSIALFLGQFGTVFSVGLVSLPQSC